MSNNSSPSTRATEFRRALVAMANLEPYARRKPPVRVAIGAIAVFALAGALTGGAIATAGKVDPDVLAAQAGAANTAQSSVRTDDGELIGRPFVRSASGTQTINVGHKPAGASVLVEGFGCLDPGHFVTLLDSRKIDSFDDCSVGGSGADYRTVSGTGEHVLTLQTQKGVRFSVWLSWAHIPRFTASQAQKQELADRVVTRDEELAAFYRFAGCLTALGHPLARITTGLVPGYSESNAALADGADSRCFTTEYEQVDATWQGELADGSVGSTSVRACPSPAPVAGSSGPQRRLIRKGIELPVLTGCPWIG